MRWLAWLGLILLFGLVAVDVYWYLDRYRPLEKRYQELLEKHTRLLSQLPAEPPAQPPEPHEPSLLEGLEQEADTTHRLSATFKTLDLFAKWSDRFRPGGSRLLEQLLVGVNPKRIQQVTIRMYQGPYKTLTRKRLKALRRWFVQKGVPEARIRTLATDLLRRWHTRIDLRL